MDSSFSNAPQVPKNGPAKLQPSLRSLRHLNGVTGKNFRMERDYLLHSYFSMHKIVENTQSEELHVEEEPFYISEIVYYCNNPQWCALPKFKFELQKFLIVVWDCCSNPLQIVQQHVVYLKDLKYIGTEDLVFPENSLVFQLVDGLYTLPETRQLLVEKQQIQNISSLPSPAGNLKPSLTRKDFLNILEKKIEIKNKQDHQLFLLKSIEQKLQKKKDYFALVKQRDEMRDRVNKLREEYQHMKEAIEIEKNEVTELKSFLLPTANSLNEQNITLEQQQQHLLKCQKDLKEKNLQYKKTMFFLRRDVLELVHQLKLIYTITKVKHDYWTICSLPLPNSAEFNNYDEELIAVALGHVCHLVSLLAKYLDVPVRYEMIPRCSRSSIVDNISNKGNYPLYSKGMDKGKFDYGVMLLVKNLEQLLQAQKLEHVSSTKDLLPNINHLLENLGQQRVMLLAKYRSPNQF